MFLELEKIRWKNFNSYGEMWTEISLTRNPITVIVGKNGYGKSTVTDALSFNLFGKPIRKNKKGNLVNRRNKKGLLTESYFKVDGDEYMVRRGVKPDVFEIYKGDVLLNQDASSRDYQKILESNILKMNFVTFTQSVIVSKTLYTPFMQLPSAKRREYVESILRLRIFSSMSKIHKGKFDELKDKFEDAKYDFEKLTIKYDEAVKMIDMTQKMIEANSQEKTKMINDQITAKQAVMNDLVAEYKNYEKDKKELDSSIKSKYNTNLNTLNKLENKRDDLVSELEKLNTSDNKCAMCGNTYSEDHFENHKKEISEKIVKIDDAVVKLKETVESLQVELDQYNNDLAENNKIESEMNSIKRLLSTHKGELDSLKTELSSIKVDTTELDKLQEKLYNISHDKDNKEQEYKDLSKQVNYSNLVTSMLKDSGIKSTIIDKSIPLINKLINKNLSDFGFFVKFELDSEFNETIAVRGFESASYADFSEGEKLRIDMAILLAWRDIALLQNAMFCNVLFLDEITDASMDDEGTEIFAKMLQSLKDNNVFIITHKPEKLDNIARTTITIEKKDGYSYIKN